MHRDFTLQKRIIPVVLGLLVAADLGLAMYSWRLASSPHRPQKELDDLKMRMMVLKGDIDSAQDIKDHMPATRKDCEKFEQSLLPASTGYSAILAELDEIAKKSGGLQMTLSNKEKELSNRGMTELTLDATVSGDYGSIVRFVNGLQRSERLYIVDGLALASDTQNQNGNGPIRVGLHIRTYFREAA